LFGRNFVRKTIYAFAPAASGKF